MRPISSKKILIILVILLVLSRLDQVLAGLSNIYRYFSDVFHGMPPLGQLVNALLILALIYITIVRMWCNRR